MSEHETLTGFLRALEQRNIAYRLDRVRDAIMVIVAVPGQRWEVEFFEDGNVEAECFVSTGEIRDSEALDEIIAIGS